MHRSAPWLALFLVLAGLFLIRESDHPYLERVDEYFLDWLVREGSTPARRPALTVVAIDDSSMARHQEWPWKPLDFALFLKAILPARPGVVGIEPVLRWDDDPPYLQVLRNYLLRTPKLLLAAELDTVRDPDDTPLPLPILPRVRGNLAALPEFATLKQTPLPALAAGATIGAIHLQPEADGRLRRIPMILRYRGDAIPSLVLQAIMLWMQLVPDDIELEIGQAIHLGPDLSVPIDESGNLLVNFRCLGPVGRVGFDTLLLAVEEIEAGLEPGFNPETLARQIVFLGRTDATSRIHLFPTGKRGSQVEAVAAAISTIQQRGFILPPPLYVQLGIVGVLAILSLLLWRVSKFTTLFITPILGVAYAMAANEVFGAYHLWLPAALPYSLLAVVLVFRLAGKSPPSPGQAPDPPAP